MPASPPAQKRCGCWHQRHSAANAHAHDDKRVILASFNVGSPRGARRVSEPCSLDAASRRGLPDERPELKTTRGPSGPRTGYMRKGGSRRDVRARRGAKTPTGSPCGHGGHVRVKRGGYGVGDAPLKARCKWQIAQWSSVSQGWTLRTGRLVCASRRIATLHAASSRTPRHERPGAASPGSPTTTRTISPAAGRRMRFATTPQ